MPQKNSNGTYNVYVYGTLRPGNGEPFVIPGEIYDLGWYPGLKLLPETDGKFVVAERIEADDERLAKLDSYEGYYEDDHKHSLYLRVPFLDGWVYVYNRPLEGRTPVLSGDWLSYRGETGGVNNGI